jgi:hypothetical protein
VAVPILIDAAAPTGLRELRFVARGVQNGKVVEKEGWTRYRWSGKAWMDAETRNLLATIADPPLLVLETPNTVTISNKEESTFELLVKRFDGGADPLVLAAGEGAPGLEISSDPVPAGASKARVKVRCKGSAAASLVLLGTAGGRVLGRSPEIRLEREDPGRKGVAK